MLLTYIRDWQLGRPKEFDRQDVLAKALDLFWEKGYESTSMQELVTAMGIGRASLYDTFGSKQQLFVESLDYYATVLGELILKPLQKEGSARQVLADFFDSTVEQLCEGTTRPCLLVKSALGQCGREEPVEQRVQGTILEAEHAFRRLVERGQEQGEIGRDKDAGALGRFFTHTLHGLHVGACVRPDRDVLGDVVRSALASLD